MRVHWDQIAATDFFTAEVWTPLGLKTYYVLFMIELIGARFGFGTGAIECTERLGGLLKFYHRAA